MTAIIQLNDIEKSFGALKVLTGVTLDLQDGDISAIIGKSGAGKSVLLKIIVGLLQPDAGEISFGGKSFFSMTRNEIRNFRHRVSYMFQNSALFDAMTIMDNIALPLIERRELKKSVIHEKVLETLAQLDLEGVEDKYPAQLSGGMQKRVALARALITDPEIVLFDEPTTGLDPIRKNIVHGMIAHYQKYFKFTGVVVSHEIPDIFYIAQKVALLAGGKIMAQGAPAEIQTSTDPVVRDFIGIVHPISEEKGTILFWQIKNIAQHGAEKIEELQNAIADLFRQKLPAGTLHVRGDFLFWKMPDTNIKNAQSVCSLLLDAASICLPKGYEGIACTSGYAPFTSEIFSIESEKIPANAVVCGTIDLK